MEKRLFLAVAISFALVFLWASFTKKFAPPPPQEPENGVEQPAEPGQPGEPGEPGEPREPRDPASPGPAEAPAPSEPVPPAAAEDAASPQKDYVPDKIRTVVPPAEGDELAFVFTSRGGALEGARLLTSLEADKKTPLDLIVPPADDLLFGQIDDTLLSPKDGAPGEMDRQDDPAGPLRSRHWTRDEKAEAASPERDVVYTYTTGSGAVWTKQWILPSGENRYDVRLRLSYRPGGGDDPAIPPRVKLLATTGVLRPHSSGAAFQYPNMVLLLLPKMKEPSQNPSGLAEPDAEVRPNELQLLGIRTHYFLASYYRDASRDATPTVLSWWATGTARDRREKIEEHIAAYFAENPMEPGRPRMVVDEPELGDRIRAGVAGQHQAWMVIEVPPSTAAAPRAVELPFYLGPIERQVLKQDIYTIPKRVVTYPPAFFAPDILAKALLWIYDLFRSIFLNAGIAVILMTLVVRSMMMPLSIKNQLSMRQYSRKIAKIKPKLDELKAKFASKPQKFREEQAKLYREHGVGFPAGCLMLFVQLPIFFALFSSLRTEYTLRNAAFLWISDLSGPDKLIDFGRTILDIGILTIFSINILPLLMVVLSVWQQRSMPKPADEQQAQQMRMMKWMPIVFAVILYNYTAGLALYMVFSSAIAILESKIVRWKDRQAGDGTPAAAWPGSTT